MDRIDVQIVSELQRDGRAPWSEIGRKVGLSHVAVRERTRKMKFLRIQGNIDPKKLGSSVYLVLASVTPERIGDLGRILGEIPCCLLHGEISGTYNLFALMIGGKKTVERIFRPFVTRMEISEVEGKDIFLPLAPLEEFLKCKERHEKCVFKGVCSCVADNWVTG